MRQRFSLERRKGDREQDQELTRAGEPDLHNQEANGQSL
jgi:hypothetical protein